MDAKKTVVFALLVDDEGKLSADFNTPAGGFTKEDVKTISDALVHVVNHLLKVEEESPDGN